MCKVSLYEKVQNCCTTVSYRRQGQTRQHSFVTCRKHYSDCNSVKVERLTGRLFQANSSKNRTAEMTLQVVHSR